MCHKGHDPTIVIQPGSRGVSGCVACEVEEMAPVLVGHVGGFGHEFFVNWFLKFAPAYHRAPA